MLAEFRTAVFELIEAANIAPVWDVIPDDVNELPCVVVARPLTRQTATAVVFDLELELFIIGLRQQAGGSEQGLTVLADQLWLLFNGTRATNNNGYSLGVQSAVPSEQNIAGLGYPAYTMTIES